MRQVLLLLLPGLAGCVDVADGDGGDPRALQEAACAAVIAAHVGRPESEVTARWIVATDGLAQVEARDGDRVHVCQVTASGQVVGYTHPGA